MNNDLIIPLTEEQRKEKLRARSKKIFKTKWIMLFVSFFLVFVVIDLAHVYYHEHVHGAIYDAYGVEYTYGFKFNILDMAFFTKADDRSNCDVVCMSLQLENEIFTYNIMYLFYALWMIFFIYLIKCFWDDVRLNAMENYYD
jgi:hypothetical protein